MKITLKKHSASCYRINSINGKLLGTITFCTGGAFPANFSGYDGHTFKSFTQLGNFCQFNGLSIYKSNKLTITKE